MNKQTRGLDLEKILFFDIETVYKTENLDINSKEFELYAWSMRDKPTGFIPPANEVIKHYKKNAALSKVFNKVVVVSIAFIRGNTLYYKAIVGEQKEIVKEFYDLVRQTGFKVCGHNIIGFDLPTLRIKAFEEDMDLSIIPESINDVGKKPWDLDKFIVDTMSIIKGTDYNNMSLDAACMLKGIKSSKDDISGAYVSQVYYQEGVDRIAKYCNKDVIATAELLCSLQGKTGYITEYVDKSGEELKKNEPVNALDHILASGELTSRVVESIVEFTKKNKLDPENVLLLVKTALSYSKEYQKVDKEDYSELKTALGLDVDYSMIQPVVDKGNLGKSQANALIKLYKDSSSEVKDSIVELTRKFLVENGKHEQKTAKSSLEFLKLSFIKQ